MKPSRAIIFVSSEHLFYEENDNLKRALVPISKFVQLHQSFTKSQTGIKWLTFKLKTAIIRSEFNICGPNLCSFGYKVWSTFITKFRTTKFFILIWDIHAIIHQCLVTMLWQQQPCDIEAFYETIRLRWCRSSEGTDRIK